MATDFDNLPDPNTYPAPPDPNAPRPPEITAGETAPGSAITSGLSYIGSRGARAISQIMQPSPQTDPKTGETYYIDPISKERTSYQPIDIPPLQKAPDPYSEAMGSGFENVLRHPIQSAITPGMTFASGVSNELLKDAPVQLREGVDAAFGLIGPRGIYHMLATPAHLLSGHFGGIGTIVSSLLHAPASSKPAFDAANLLSRLYKGWVGTRLGSEQPLSQYQPPEQPTPTGTPTRGQTTAPAGSGGGNTLNTIGDALWNWGGVLGLPSMGDITRTGPKTQWSKPPLQP